MQKEDFDCHKDWIDIYGFTTKEGLPREKNPETVIWIDLRNAQKNESFS